MSNVPKDDKLSPAIFLSMLILFNKLNDTDKSDVMRNQKLL